MANRRFSGSAFDIFDTGTTNVARDLFLDHLGRTSAQFRYKSHPLRTPESLNQYYETVADALAGEIRASGATHCLFFNLPHLAHDTLVHQVAKSMGLSITLVSKSLFPDRFFSLHQPEHNGAFAADSSAPP